MKHSVSTGEVISGKTTVGVLRSLEGRKVLCSLRDGNKLETTVKRDADGTLSISDSPFYVLALPMENDDDEAFLQEMLIDSITVKMSDEELKRMILGYWAFANVILFSVAASILLLLKIYWGGLDVVSIISVLVMLVGVSIIILAKIQEYMKNARDSM